MTDVSPLNSILEAVLKETMGLNISSIGPTVIKHAIGRRMRSLGLDNTFQYLQKVKSSPQELNELIDEVAVNETWFFRDEAPFVALADYALAFARQHKGKILKLLSVPCASGEEPYSMAMTLIDAGIRTKDFSIDAVDISRHSLALAEEGFYRGNSFRTPYAQKYLRYFNKTRQGYAIDPTIKQLVRFHRGNLLHLSRYLTSTTYQVIFCRNLLIYLDASFHQKAIATFASLLADNGLLFIGHAEAGIFTGSPFVPANYPKAFAFRKKERSGLPGVELGGATKDPGGSSAVLSPPLPPAPPASAPEGYDGEIRRYETLLRESGPSAELFYRLAILFEGKRDWDAAVKMLKKAIYLDPNAIEAVDMLAAIYQRLGDEKNFRACVNRGRRIVTRMTTKIAD